MMFDTPLALEIQAGESKTLEFKRELPKGQQIAKIQLELQRLNISFDELPNGLNMNQIHQGRSEIRNRVLARVFKTLGYVEHWGSGIQRIKQMCADEGLQEPEFLETGDFFDVKLYRPES